MKAMKIKEVIDRVGLSKSTIYRLAKANQFPRPIKLAENSSAWIKSEVDAWLQSKIEARG
ncbi:AlpA family transcriptional regulator [Francisella sp. LA112445]|uniref:helix-turn-helix transcriptional regulator n=1 Tax=Francisella sp. LA112445 TaxID=1395624 RepID=UPI001788ABF7|nr:AlpA family transcriptional regulator [Francisella sp. LA112445]QIW10594.1 AlpA family transcriptional regulator [Francisella sp. LA112445]